MIYCHYFINQFSFFDSGNYLVRVRAQVMTRDDSTGGWVPMGAGGLSNVSVCKGSVPGEDDKIEYLICGRRITDHTVSFNNVVL